MGSAAAIESTEASTSKRDCEVTAVRQTSRGRMVARSAKMLAVVDVLERVAPSTCTVLVTGESGTGKELAVALLHDASKRRDAALVAVNCGAIAENLVESELFGHVRGAFTGAVNSRRGLVAEAQGGTLFLDEVGELPLMTQVKLLRLLQQREYTPVGASVPVKAEVRIVAATHRDLRADVASGRFREDLFHRLNVIHVHLPPLRDRADDIAALAHSFLRTAGDRVGRPEVVTFAPGVIEALEAATWPGNVRELENAIERAVVLAEGDRVELSGLPEGICPEQDLLNAQVEYEPPPASCRRISAMVPPMTDAEVASAETSFDVPPPPPANHSPMRAHVETTDGLTDLRGQVEAFENDLIRRALSATKFNKQRAAEMLGLKRTTLIEMMKRKGI